MRGTIKNLINRLSIHGQRETVKNKEITELLDSGDVSDVQKARAIISVLKYGKIKHKEAVENKKITALLSDIDNVQKVRLITSVLIYGDDKHKETVTNDVITELLNSDDVSNTTKADLIISVLKHGDDEPKKAVTNDAIAELLSSADVRDYNKADLITSVLEHGDDEQKKAVTNDAIAALLSSDEVSDTIKAKLIISVLKHGDDEPKKAVTNDAIAELLNNDVEEMHKVRLVLAAPEYHASVDGSVMRKGISQLLAGYTTTAVNGTMNTDDCCTKLCDNLNIQDETLKGEIKQRFNKLVGYMKEHNLTTQDQLRGSVLDYIKDCIKYIVNIVLKALGREEYMYSYSRESNNFVSMVEKNKNQQLQP